MSFAQPSSLDYSRMSGTPPLMNFGFAPRRVDPAAAARARTPIGGGPEAGLTPAKLKLAGGGEAVVNVPAGKEKDANALEAAFTLKQATDPTLRDRRAVIKNDDPNAKLKGNGNVITGIAPKEIERPGGTTLAGVTGTTTAVNKDLSGLTVANSRIDIKAGNSSVNPIGVGTTTLGSISGDSIKVGNTAKVGQVLATNAKPDVPASPFLSTVKRRNEAQFPTPQMA
jgi:hypothetical protein